MQVSDDGTPIASFTYDGFGRRASKTAGGSTHSFVYDGSDILEDRISGGATMRHIHGPAIDQPLASVDDSGNPTYYLADHLGSIVQTTDASGAVALTRQYDPYGNLLQGDSTPGYAFTGREWDPEIGLYYYRARYYDPGLGRFIGADPIGLAGGVNCYAYVGGNPAARVDPSGLDWSDAFDALGSLLGALQDYVFTQEQRQRLVDAQNAAMKKHRQTPDGLTHCNSATLDIAEAMGASTAELQGKANAIGRNLANSKNYYVVDTWQEAQAIANRGGLVIASYINPNSARPGHVATVRPQGAGDTIISGNGPGQGVLLGNVGPSNLTGVIYQNHAIGSLSTTKVIYYAPSVVVQTGIKR